jgi:hypothetical protein
MPSLVVQLEALCMCALLCNMLVVANTVHGCNTGISMYDNVHTTFIQQLQMDRIGGSHSHTAYYSTGLAHTQWCRWRQQKAAAYMTDIAVLM